MGYFAESHAWGHQGLRTALLMWLLAELAWCQDGEETLDPEELAGGEMHLGAVKAPSLDMPSVEHMRRLHNIVDLDGSGAVSLQEMLEHSQRLDSQASSQELHNVKGLDEFKDGKLSLAETLEVSFESDFDAHGKQADAGIRKLRFNQADQDADGHLDEAELIHFFTPNARSLALAEIGLASRDQDNSGGLSKTEFFSESGSAYVVKDEAELMDEDHATFRDLDQDSSGEISQHELQDWESGRFHTKAELGHMVAEADSNHDGEVSLDEFLSARDQINGTSAMFHLLEWHAHQDL